MPSNDTRIAILDVGKTNLKLLIASADGEPLDQLARLNDFTGSHPYPMIHLEGIESWFLEALGTLAHRHRIAAIIATTHGCTGVLCNANGAVLPMMDYEAAYPPQLEAAYARIAPPYAEVMTNTGPGAIRIARQLLWQQSAYPKEFARARHYLAFPQYLSWRLGGRIASEISHIAAQNHLWAPLAKDFSSIVHSQGWARLFPAFARAGEVIGTLHPAIAARTGLSPQTQVLCGVHDSNANLFRYKAAGMEEGTLFSTGTWMIGFDRAFPLAKLDEARGMVSNVDVDGQPVSSTITMSGREYALLVGDALDAPEEDVLKAARRLIGRGTMALPSFTSSDGLFPGSAAQGRVVGPLAESAAEFRALGALYLAFTASACLNALGNSHKPVIIDGGFAGNRVFAGLLAALRLGQPVSVSHSKDGTALGAALLWKKAGRSGSVSSVGVERVAAVEVGGLHEMARAWERAA